MELATLTGRVLDAKYQLERILGQGGMGAVFQAIHLGTKRPVAVKVIAPRFVTNEDVGERFRREAEAAGRLLHPNVVNVTDFGAAQVGRERISYLVMEYLEGMSLGTMLEKRGPLPLTLTVDIIEQTCLGVGHAHRQGVIHRDLKPDNIWLQSDHRGGYIVKVLDFGLAKLRDSASGEVSGPSPTAATPVSGAPPAGLAASGTDAGAATIVSDLSGGPRAASEVSSSDETVLVPAAAAEPTLIPCPPDPGRSRSSAGSELTQVGSILGTPLYMSPEQCRGGPLDARSDIYSLGVITYHMLAGATPFTGNTSEVISGHVRTAPPSLARERPDLPASTAVHIMSALAKNPSERPATPESFAASLRITADGMGGLTRKSKVTSQLSSWFMMTSSLIAFLPCGVLAGLMYHYLPKWLAGTPAAINPVFYLSLALLTLLAARVNAAIWTLLAMRIRRTRAGFVKPLGVLWHSLKRLPAFWVAAVTSTLVIPTRLRQRRSANPPDYVAATLVPCVVAAEGLSGRAAMERARVLVAPLCSLASSLRAREFGIGVGSGVALSVFMALIGSLAGRPPEDAQTYLWVMAIYMSWMGVTVGATYAAAPMSELYFLARQAQGEPGEETPLETIDPGIRRKRRGSREWAARLWYVLPVLMLLFVLLHSAAPTLDSLVGAVKNGEKTKVERMLAARVDPNTPDKHGTAPLIAAAVCGHGAILRDLLKAGAAVNESDNDGWTALMHAANGGQDGAVEILLQNGASVLKQSDNGETALIVAARSGRPAIVRALLRAGSDARVADRKGETALAYADENGHSETAEILREAGSGPP
jgi:serine/threonine protein kinase